VQTRQEISDRDLVLIHHLLLLVGEIGTQFLSVMSDRPV